MPPHLIRRPTDSLVRPWVQHSSAQLFFTMPAPVVKLLFGEMGEELLLQGQSVVPKKLKDSGFEFQYPNLDLALTDLLG